MAVLAALDQKRRKTYREEKRWLDLVKELRPEKLRRGFIGCNVPPDVAGNLVWFLYDQVTLDRSLSESTRNRYRRKLEELDPEKVRVQANRPMSRYINSGTRRAA